MTPDQIAEFHRLSELLDNGLAEMRRQGDAYAKAENAYRKGKRSAWRHVPPELTLAKEREAWVDAESADDRMARDNADMDRQDALESVRSRRAQLSALQTVTNADTEEAKFARTGPEWAA